MEELGAVAEVVADLQRVLLDTLGHDGVHTGSELVDLRETDGGVRLVFADGREAEADVVVGADGARSTVRRWIADGETSVYSGTSGFRGLIPAERLTELPDPGAIQFWTGPGGHLLHYPIGDGGVVNFLAVVDQPRRWEAGSRVVDAAPGEIAASFAGWHPAVVQMVAATELHQRWALFGQRPLHRWHRGRAVLLGDAAHAMLPHHGQGANQTIEERRCSRTACPPAVPRTWKARCGPTSGCAVPAPAASRGPPGWPRGSCTSRTDLMRRDEFLDAVPDSVRWIHEHDPLAATR